MKMSLPPEHFEALPEETKKAFFLLGEIPALAQFYLAGGTALALWLGHRISADLDFFSESQFSGTALLDELSRRAAVRLEQRDPDTVTVSINGVKTSFFRYPYLMLEKPAETSHIAVAALADIACMKLEALASRGTKRDFIDIYCIAQTGMPMTEMLALFQKKYARLNVNLLHIKKSLVYFDDAEHEPMPKMRTVLEWETVKDFFLKEMNKDDMSL